MSLQNDMTFSTFSHAKPMKLAIDKLRAAQINAVPHVLFCGGFHSSMHGTKGSAFKAFCQQQGWHFTRFDYRGHGHSDGEPAQFTLNDWLEDTLAVLDDQDMPTIVVGSSMGAWLATHAALRRPKLVSALVLLAAAPDFLQRRVTSQLSTADQWDLQQGQVVKLPSQYDDFYPITQALLDSGNDLSLLDSDALAELQCPVRLIHGSADTDAPVELAIQLMQRLPDQHDARLSLLHSADHRLSDERSLSYIYSVLTNLAHE